MMRFCLIGAGRAGLVHANNITHRIKGAELVALCDAQQATLDRVGDELGVSKRYTDYRDAVNDPTIHAVIIVTPTFLHCEVACAATAKGKHIFLEKPMAITVAECEKINAAVAAAGVKLQIGFMRRFDSGFMQAKEILESGAMGRVTIIKSTGRGPGLPSPWMYNVTQSNGILAEVNSHDFDSVRWLVGNDIQRVYAEAANFKCPDAREAHPDFYDNATVSLRFVDDTIGTIDGTCPAHYGYDARVEVLCEKGLLMIGNTATHGFTQVNVEGCVMTNAVKSWRTLFKDAYLAEMEHFIDCVEHDKTPRVSGMDGLKAVQAVVAANQSLREGLPITLGSIGAVAAR